jgi:uncharacterized protein (DUF2235 family)
MEDPPLPGIQKESPSSEFISTYDYTLPRRLVVCLDGTWNRRDSGTNIYHLSNLVQEGRVRDKDGKEWFQIIYYDEGVGTGLLDGITGGAFGIGLSENVREAYDWLVEKYRDADLDRPDDEIYVFGFSRGAFTARSLVGLIAKCGLVRRGSPIPPTQLWDGYRILGRYKNLKTGAEPPRNLWERIFKREAMPYHPLRELVLDAWEKPPRDPTPDGPVNRTEKLLVPWSRRVRIKCLGVFDTVGSMGIDALAIPWVRDKVAQFHDTQLSSLTDNAFQALAIDEHRANFPHIPWHRRVDSSLPPGKTEHGGNVEQRWFIGAHSNVGGGYADNMLAQYPLAWMIEKTRACGLHFREHLDNAPDPGTRPPYPKLGPYPEYVPLVQRIKGENGMATEPRQVRDSFTDIAHGLWSGLIRSKREYRQIAPPPEFLHGVEVQSINEQPDESVFQLVQEEYANVKEGHRYNAPNLWEYWKRNPPPGGLPSGYERPKHRYFYGDGAFLWWCIWFICVAGVGLATGYLLGGGRWYWLVLIAPVVASGLDWLESRLNHALVLSPNGVIAESANAVMTFCLVVRLIILGAIIAGIIFAIWFLWPFLIAGDPSKRAWWLLGLDVLLLNYTALSNWCAAPMKDAKAGSIVRLQLRMRRAAASNWLQSWAENKTTAEGKQLLMPVAHSIVRDMFPYIPVYIGTLLIGNQVAAHCAADWLQSAPDWLRPLILHWSSWSVWIVLIAATADYIEDFAHLRYIAIYPKPPIPPLVWVAFLATIIKFISFSIASFGFLAAIVLIVIDQASRLWHWQTGAISLVAILVTLVALLFSPLTDAAISKLHEGKKIVKA